MTAFLTSDDFHEYSLEKKNNENISQHFAFMLNLIFHYFCFILISFFFFIFFYF